MKIKQHFEAHYSPWLSDSLIAWGDTLEEVIMEVAQWNDGYPLNQDRIRYYEIEAGFDGEWLVRREREVHPTKEVIV